MVLENATNVSSSGIFGSITSLTQIFQAIGGLIIAYIIFGIINIILNRRKNKQIEDIRKLLEKINKKLS